MTSLFFEQFEERWLLALLCNTTSVYLDRINEIKRHYSTLLLAFEDKFSKISTKEKNWVQKISNLNWASEYGILVSNCEKYNISLLIFSDKEYPYSLTLLADQPLALYFVGNLNCLSSTSEMITVVGSRNTSRYSELVMNNILKPACLRGVGVVSGLAVGVDGFSHKIALESKASTIAVIGSGLDEESFYPAQNYPLVRQIVEQNGLVLSEYPPKRKATQFNFPRRNRILAALTEITWVVQAGIASGTLITARLALELGKTVATTPGSILESSMQGSNQLMKDGAQIITTPEDIFGLLGLVSYSVNQVEKPKEFSSSQEQLVYEKLSLSPRVADSIGTELGLEISTLSMHLTLLEMNGLAINVGENLWVRGS